MAEIKTRIADTSERMETITEEIGKVLVKSFHLLALFAIGAAIVWSAVHAFMGMVDLGKATIEDILLLFIYLELGAMVGIYFYTRHMPVRFLIYVGITALTRLLIEFISVEHRPDQGVLYISGAIVLLSISVLILRYGSSKFPSAQKTGASDFVGDEAAS